MNPALAATSSEASRPTTEDWGRRCAFAATEGEARPVGSCEAEVVAETDWPHHPQVVAPSSISEEQFEHLVKAEEWYPRALPAVYAAAMRKVLSALATLAVASVLWAVEGSAGGVRWMAPERWPSAPARPMRMATYTIPAVSGGEAGECGVFYFGKGKGGSVEENLARWEKQIESGPPAKRSEKTVHGLTVHLLDATGSYTASGGPMMQSQEKKPGWRLLGAIVEAPEGLVFFKCVGPAATLKTAQKEFEDLVASVAKATVKA